MYYLFALFLFFGIDAAGVVLLTSTGLPFPGLESLKFFELLMIIFIYLLITNKNRFVNFDKGKLKSFIFLLILLNFITLVYSFLDKFSVRFMLDVIKTLSSFLFFYIVTRLFREREKLEKITKILIIISVVNSFIGIIQYFGMITFLKGPNIFVMEGFIFARIYHPSVVLSCLSIFLSTALLLLERKEEFRNPIISKSLLITSIIANSILIVLTFSRSFWIGVIIGELITYFILFGFNFRKFVFSVVIGVVLLSFNIASKDIGVDFKEDLMVRATSAVEDVQTGTGSFIFRFDLLERKWNGIKKINPFLGNGFDFKDDPSFFDSNYNPIAITRDSGVANIIVVYGLLGLIVYSLVFIISTRYSIKYFMLEGKDFFETAILCVMIVFNFFTMITIFFSDSIIYRSSVIPLYLIWGFGFSVMNNINKREFEKNISQN